MSKELVISAASHERRVAILEEGQLVEIYIEREKEFALVGSIYKGKVTRVLPGMQSAFVDIGLDGDAFLYVSDVFENLEDYDHGHPHEQPQTSVAPLPPAIGAPVEVLPGESLARASEHHEEAHHDEFHQHEAHTVDEQHASHEDAPAAGDQHLEHHDALPSAPPEEHHAEAAEERQPDSNASAPQNFAPHYNPTQNYPARGGNDRPGQSFSRGGDRGGDRGGGRGRGGRLGRRGGRPRGGTQGGARGGRTPPSEDTPPQGGEYPREPTRAEVEAAPSGETADSVGESPAAGDSLSEPLQEPVVNHVEAQRNDVELNEDQVAALASSFVEAKQEETSDAVEADAIVGGAEFDEEEEEETEAEETIVTEVSQLSAEEAEEVEAGRAASRAEFAADVAQEHAEHAAAHGSHEHGEQEHVDTNTSK